MRSFVIAVIVVVVCAVILLRDRVTYPPAGGQERPSRPGDVITVLLFVSLIIYGTWAHGALAGIGLVALAAIATPFLAALLDGWLTPFFRRLARQPEPAIALVAQPHAAATSTSTASEAPPAGSPAPARDEAARDRIWRIRDSIQDLEDTKDAIVALLETHPAMDESHRKMWIGDAKEAYYNVVAAWQMLSAAADKPERAADAGLFLDTAQGACARVASEMRSLEAAAGLEARLNDAFQKCLQQIVAELAPYQPPSSAPQPPTERIVRVDSQHYELPCSVCGKISAVFRVGRPENWDKPEEYLMVSGITGSLYPGYAFRYAEKAMDLLGQGDLKALHEHLEYGIDAYCPECDAIFCWEHYSAYETYDEGFYDCTYATCPQGHRRKIDD